jgi:hypothetical protein
MTDFIDDYPPNHLPIVGSVDKQPPIFWSFDLVEAELVECAALWRRSPPAGHRPLKSAWPEARYEAGDHGKMGGENAAAMPRPLPLSRAEVARRDAVSAWLEAVPDEANRRIVCLAVMALASGQSQIPWSRIIRQMGQTRGKGGLRHRYARAIHAICVAANAGKVPLP